MAKKAAPAVAPAPVPFVPAEPSVADAPVVINSLAEVETALAELGKIAGDEARFKQQLDFAVKSATSRFTSLLYLTDRPTVSFADRKRNLETAIEAFFTANSDAILPKDKKSVALNNGTIGTRQAKAGIEELPSAEPDKPSWVERIKKGLIEALNLFHPFKRVPSSMVMKVDVEFNTTALLHAYEAKQLNDADLEKAGFKYRPPIDKFFCKPSTQSLTSHPSAPA